MPKGNSGRVVVEVDAAFKRQLYRVLDAQNVTLKDWFIQAAKDHIEQHDQPRLLPIPMKQSIRKEGKKP